MNKTIIATAALLAGLNLAGCALLMAGGGYHADHGDLVSDDGSVRYIGWCDVHTHFSRCQTGPESTITAASPLLVGAVDEGEGAHR